MVGEVMAPIHQSWEGVMQADELTWLISKHCSRTPVLGEMTDRTHIINLPAKLPKSLSGHARFLKIIHMMCYPL